MTIYQLVDYVMLNRTGKVFDGYSPINIADTFVEAAQDNLLLYAADGDTITGVCHAKRFGRIIHVCNILTTKKGVLRQFIKRFTELHPGFELRAERNGRLKNYNTQRLISKILRKEQ